MSEKKEKKKSLEELHEIFSRDVEIKKADIRARRVAVKKKEIRAGQKKKE